MSTRENKNGFHDAMFLDWLPKLNYYKTLLDFADLRRRQSENDTSWKAYDVNNTKMESSTESPKILNTNIPKPETGAIPKSRNIERISGPSPREIRSTTVVNGGIRDDHNSQAPAGITRPIRLGKVNGHTESFNNSVCDHEVDLSKLELITSIEPLMAAKGEIFEGRACDEFYPQSPLEFYVHRKLDEKLLDNLAKELAVYGEGKGMISASKMAEAQKLTNLVGTFWVCQFEDNSYYRVRINSEVQSSDGLTMYSIQYIDWGNSDIVPLDRLYVMKDSLSKIPAKAIKCRLFNLEPTSGSWTIEDEEYLCHAMNACDKFPLKITVKAVESASGLSFYPTLDVDILNIDDVSGTTISERLVEDKRAFFKTIDTSIIKCESNGIAPEQPPRNLNPENPRVTRGSPAKQVASPSTASSIESSKSPKKLGLKRKTALDALRQLTNIVQEPPDEVDWDDDLEDDYDITHGNAYGTNLDDPMTAIIGFQTQDVNYCRLFAEGRCKKGKFCPYKHIKKEVLDNMVMNRGEEMSLELMPQDSLVENEVYLAQIIAINNHHVRVRFPVGPVPLTAELLSSSSSPNMTPHEQKYKDLMNGMKKKYSKKEFQEQQNIFPNEGALVAVRESEDIFFRGKVLESGPNIIKIECLDSGKLYQVPRKDVYKLHNEFTQLPSMSYVVQMEGLKSDRNMFENLLKHRVQFGVKVIEIDRATGDEIATLKTINLHTLFNKK